MADMLHYTVSLYCTVQDTVGGAGGYCKCSDSYSLVKYQLSKYNIYPWNCTVKIHPSARGVLFFVFRSNLGEATLVVGVLKLLDFSPHGTCQMLCEQLAYQTITVMVDCPLWFRHVCGLTNFAHTLESHVNNRLFFWVQLSDFGKEGRKEEKNIYLYPLPGYEAMIYHRSFSPVLTSVCMCRAGPWPPEWTEALTSLLCLGADKEECVRGREPIYASFLYSLYSPRCRPTRSDLKRGPTLVWSG